MSPPLSRLLAAFAAAACLASLWPAAGCGGGTSAGPDAAPAPRDASVANPDASAGVDAGGTVDERGFLIRVPQERTIPMTDFGGGQSTTTAWDLDYVCTFVAGAHDGFFYVQATPVEYQAMGGYVYRTDGAWLSFAGAVSAAAGALYDFGGNHHNDSVELDLQGKHYRYYHSSFGFGWRSCMPPDCLQVGPAGALEQDGCTPERTLPVVCVEVAHDGTVAPLLDTYKKCLGDPNARDAGL